MLGLFALVKDRIKLKLEAACIDNWAFKLHYRVSVAIFFVFTILVCTREYFGGHIHCLNDMPKPGFSKVIETFCFVTSTFTLVDEFDVDRIRLGYVPHPGVGAYGLTSKRPIQRHSYYQWVPFFLFIQSIMFYLTRLLWKKLEDGRINKLASCLHYSAYSFLDKQLTIHDKEIPSRTQILTMLERIRHNFRHQITTNQSWAFFLILCEILNVIHVIFQVYITNIFLKKSFFSLGTNYMANGTKTLDQTFPKVTKCTFHMYGQSGTIQTHDALCIMALNIIHEKIFLFLWFWFLVVFVVSCGVLVWRTVSWLLYRRVWFSLAVFGGSHRGRLFPSHIEVVVKNCSYRDWLLLRYFSKNLDSLAFRELFLGIFDALAETQPIWRDEEEVKTKLT